MLADPHRRTRRAMPVAVIAVLAGLLVLPAASVAGDQRVSRPHLRGVAARQSDDGYNRDVRIHNQTGWTMTYLYPSSGGDWGGDLLGSGVLSPGDSIVVTIDDGSGACRYALLAEFDNGQSLERNGINACQVADYYFTR